MARQRQRDCDRLIEVSGVTKRFGEVKALDGVSFGVSRGELFGFLGPNGAGKTTTINILTGLARADTGNVRIAGIDCVENHGAAQHLIGIVPDESNLYPELSGFDNLCFCASLYGIRRDERRKRALRLLELFGLSGAAGRRFGGYSKGMKRKLTIAAGIVHRPEILFLDEPTTGIDVASARQIRRLIADLNGRGTTVFLTTHYIEEAERLCGRIAFIVRGRIVEVDSVSDLLRPMQDWQSLVLAVSDSPGDLARRLADAFPEHDFTPDSEGMVRVDSRREVRLGPLVRFIEREGAVVTEARRLRPSLEDVFVRITGIEADLMRSEKEGGVRR
ncbi:MAG: ABC transporter ATP-binding protein [Candidatus Fermentibacteraceae bacterium]